MRKRKTAKRNVQSKGGKQSNGPSLFFKLPPRRESAKIKKPISYSLSDLNEVTSPGQFGISKRAKISPQLQKTGSVFLKLPADALSNDQTKIVRKKFADEFAKQERLIHIQTLCRSGNEPKDNCYSFSVVPPLAYAEVQTQPESASKTPALIYPFVKDTDLAKEQSKAPDGRRFELKSPQTFLAFARGLTKLVQRIHNNGLVHSFIVPRHIIPTGRANKTLPTAYTLVGFGYSHYCDTLPVARPFAPDSNDTSETGSKYELAPSDTPFLAPEVRDRRSIGALWYPADIYSIGAILYWGITGNPPTELPRDVRRLKEEIYEKIRGSVADPRNIYRQNENIVKVLDRCLRYNPEDRFSCAEELLEALEIAALAGGAADDPQLSKKKTRTNKHGQENAVRTLLSCIARQERAASDETDRGAPVLAKDLSPLFQGLVNNFSNQAYQDARRIGRGHYEIYGHRDHLVNSLCRLLALAGKDDEYCTWTLPGYWSDDNLGSNGRFLTMNKHVARTRSTVIKRIFLVAHPFHQLTEEEQEILEAHQKAVVDVVNTSTPSVDKETPTFEVRVLDLSLRMDSSFTDKKQVSPEEARRVINDFEARNHPVAYLLRRDANNSKDILGAVFLNFISQGVEKYSGGNRFIQRRIKKLRFWEGRMLLKKKPSQTAKTKETMDNFEHDWKIAVPLATYLGCTADKRKLSETLCLAGTQSDKAH